MIYALIFFVIVAACGWLWLEWRYAAEYAEAEAEREMEE